MRTRYFALVFGIVYLVIGVLGFFPGMKTTPVTAPPLAVEAGYGLLFGLFAVNILHNIVHVIVGIWGVIAWRAFSASRVFARSVAVIFGILTIMGFIPVLQTTFGLIPLFGHDIWLHAITAIVAAYFGWATTAEQRPTVR